MDDRQKLIGNEISVIVCRVLNHLPETGEISTIAVKGHLIAEEELNRAVMFKLKSPEKFKSVKLNFFQLLSLVKCFYTDETGWIWGGLKKLNSIRNKYAHSLKPEGIESELIEFIELIESEAGLGEGKTEERMRRSIALLCAKVTLLYANEYV